MWQPYIEITTALPVVEEWLSDLFVMELTKLSNFDTSSRSMYSIRIVLAPKKMA